MKERIKNILSLIDKAFVKNYEEIDENVFGLQTKFDPHRTILKFEEVKSFFRIEFTHIFGYLDESRNISSQELLELLKENSGTFKRTSAYLAVDIFDSTPFVSLQAYHLFNKKWEDKDIAEVVSMQFSDLLMPLLMGPWPDCIIIETA